MRIWSAFARSVLGVVAVALVALPLAGRAAASDAGAERIRSYDVALEVRPDGSLQVAETIADDFGGNSRHAIERDIDTEQRGSFKPVDQTAVLLDLAARGYLSISPVKRREWQPAAAEVAVAVAAAGRARPVRVFAATEGRFAPVRKEADTGEMPVSRMLDVR